MFNCECGDEIDYTLGNLIIWFDTHINCNWIYNYEKFYALRFDENRIIVVESPLVKRELYLSKRSSSFLFSENLDFDIEYSNDPNEMINIINNIKNNIIFF